jgi:hypothetical protein
VVLAFLTYLTNFLQLIIVSITFFAAGSKSLKCNVLGSVVTGWAATAATLAFLRIIIESSSSRTKFSPRSVYFKIKGNWLLIYKGSGGLWRRMHCERASVDGRSAAIFSGAVCMTLCKIILVGSSDNALRSLISFWIRMTWSRFRFGAWEWHDGSWTKASIVTFVWQRPENNLKPSWKWKKHH